MFHHSTKIRVSYVTLIQGWRKVFGQLVSKTYEVAEVDLDLVKESQDEVKISMCRFTCSVQSTLQNAKHESSRESWGMPH